MRTIKLSLIKFQALFGRIKLGSRMGVGAIYTENSFAPGILPETYGPVVERLRHRPFTAVTLGSNPAGIIFPPIWRIGICLPFAQKNFPIEKWPSAVTEQEAGNCRGIRKCE